MEEAGVEGIKGVALRHFELNGGRAEWENWAVSRRRPASLSRAGEWIGRGEERRRPLRRTACDSSGRPDLKSV
jgi:hypothetical protein